MPILKDDYDYTTLVVTGMKDLHVSYWAYQDTASSDHNPAIMIRQQVEDTISREKVILIFTSEQAAQELIEKLKRMIGMWDFDSKTHREPLQMDAKNTKALCRPEQSIKGECR